jgi:hypothetical protein
MGRHVGEQDPEDGAHQEALPGADDDHAGHQRPPARVGPRCAEAHGQQHHAQGIDERAHHQDPSAEAGQQAGHREGGGEEGQRHREEDDAGAQRAQPGAVLKGQRVDENEGAERREERQADQQTLAHAGRLEERERHQRHAATRLDRPLGPHERHADEGAGHQEGDRPPGPAEGAALGQWDEEGEEGQAEEEGATGVDGGRIRRAGVGHDLAGHDQSHDPHRHIDQEDRTPLRSGDVGRDEQATEQLARRAGDARRRSVEAERPVAGIASRSGLDGGENLGEHHGGGRTLQRPEGHEQLNIGGQPAGQRRHGEGRHADEEQAAAAQGVTQTSSHDQEKGVGDGVACHHQLQHAGRGLELLHSAMDFDDGDGS